MIEIDRLAPTLRPTSRVVMKQSWRHLGFLHWEVAEAELAVRLPAGLKVDTFEGRAFVGLVPFTMQKVRPVGFPSVHGLSNFHETNVRTYVYDKKGMPGVWFFSLDAANLAAVAVARAAFALNYQFASMSLTVEGGPETPRVSYRSKRRRPSRPGPRCEVEIQAKGEAKAARPGTLDYFLVERYLLYTWNRGRLFSGRVHHSPYPLQAANCERFDETLIAANGLKRPDVSPLVHYVSGVDVDIFALKPVI